MKNFFLLCLVLSFCISGCKYNKKSLGAVFHTNKSVPDQYTVQDGESFWSIGRKFDLDPVNLMYSNGMKDPYELKPGMILNLRAEPVSEPVRPSVAAAVVSQEKNNERFSHELKPAEPKVNYKETDKTVYLDWVWPLNGKILAPFKSAKNPGSGVIIGSKEKSPVKCAADGIVVYTGRETGYTNVVIVSHDAGYYSVYAHNSEVLVKNNQAVKAGELIGYTDFSDSFQSYVLNFELRQKGTPVDPEKIIKH